jgi:hypothetical protein
MSYILLTSIEGQYNNSHSMSRLTVFSVASALLSVTQARYSNDVSDALAILQGLSANLAGPFCSSFNGGETTTTVTIGASTVTVAMEPPCSETEGYPIWQTTVSDNVSS